jgi:outer membrane biosynthesis protein TonB
MDPEMRALFLALAVCGLVVSAACASAQAKSPPARPNLEVPPAPPRVVQTTPLPEPAPPEPVELPAPTPSTPRPRPPSRETAKPDPKPETPPDPPPAAAPPVAPAPQLRTPATADVAEASRQVRDILERARKTLDSINYQRLTKARKAEYDRAKLMILQSEDAVKSEKFPYAKNLADKADQIAKELHGG